MGLTKLDIANNALIRIGDKTIESFDNTDKNTVLINQVFKQVLSEVLREYIWNCATARASLVPNAISPPFGYTYAYDLPIDYIRLIQVYDANGRFDQNIDWCIEDNKILCNEPVMNIRYIKYMEDTLQFDSLCTSALINKLAQKIAFSKTNSSKLVNELINEYESIILPRARSIDTVENKETDEQQLSTWITGRVGDI